MYSLCVEHCIPSIHTHSLTHTHTHTRTHTHTHILIIHTHGARTLWYTHTHTHTQYVQSGNASRVAFHLSDPPSSSKDHIVSHYSEEGLTVLHYATRQESTDILKELVEFCIGNICLSVCGTPD